MGLSVNFHNPERWGSLFAREDTNGMQKCGLLCKQVPLPWLRGELGWEAQVWGARCDRTAGGTRSSSFTRRISDLVVASEGLAMSAVTQMRGSC